MELPFDRSRLAERNRLEESEAIEAARRRTPAERLESALEVSALVRSLARATNVSSDPTPLEVESRVYVRPLRLLAR